MKSKIKILNGLILICLLAAVFVFSSCNRAPASSQNQRVFAVLPADIDFSLPAETWQHHWLTNHGKPIRETVNTGLFNHPKKSSFRIVDTSHIDRIIEQHKFEASEWSDSSKVAEIGRALNADCIVITTVNHSGSGYFWRVFVTVSILDINTMELLAKTDVSLKRQSWLTDHDPPTSLVPIEKAVKKMKLNL